MCVCMCVSVGCVIYAKVRMMHKYGAMLDVLSWSQVRVSISMCACGSVRFVWIGVMFWCVCASVCRGMEHMQV